MARTTAADDLAPLAKQFTDLTAARNLVVVPVTPSSGHGPVVRLDAEDMTAEAFVNLAALTGRKLLYLQSERFGATHLESLRDLADADLRRKVVTLGATAKRFLGWTITLQAAFVAEGVTHIWSAGEAVWYEELEQAHAELLPESGDDDAIELSDSDQERLIEELATELIALPAFRGVNTDAARRRVATAHAAGRLDGSVPADQADRIRWKAIARATHQATVEEHRHYAEAEQRIPDLARRIAADPAYRAARTSPARKHRVRDYLMAQADGYAPPGRLVDLVVDALAGGGSLPGAAQMLPLD